jgi:hypothetical protein
VCGYDSGDPDESYPLPGGSTPAPTSKIRKDDSARAVAQYLADMTAQLESIARAANLELVAYLLAMARAEADMIGAGTTGQRRR